MLQMLSLRRSVRLAEMLAFVFTRVLPRKWTRYDVCRDNIRTAFGERFSDRQVEELIRRMWVHLFRVVMDNFGGTDLAILASEHIAATN